MSVGTNKLSYVDKLILERHKKGLWTVQTRSYNNFLDSNEQKKIKDQCHSNQKQTQMTKINKPENGNFKAKPIPKKCPTTTVKPKQEIVQKTAKPSVVQGQQKKIVTNDLGKDLKPKHPNSKINLFKDKEKEIKQENPRPVFTLHYEEMSNLLIEIPNSELELETTTSINTNESKESDVDDLYAHERIRLDSFLDAEEMFSSSSLPSRQSSLKSRLSNLELNNDNIFDDDTISDVPNEGMTDEWSLLQIELVKQRRTSKHSKTPAGNKPTAKNLSPRVVVNTESEIEKDFIEKLADSDEENGMKGDPPKEISTDEEEHQFNETDSKGTKFKKFAKKLGSKEKSLVSSSSEEEDVKIQSQPPVIEENSDTEEYCKKSKPQSASKPMLRELRCQNFATLTSSLEMHEVNLGVIHRFSSSNSRSPSPTDMAEMSVLRRRQRMSTTNAGYMGSLGSDT